MKKLLTILTSFLALVLILTACSQKAQTSQTSSEKKVIKVGVANIQAINEILEAAKPELEKAGYTLEVINFSDYKQPNDALNNKEIDVNLFQHEPFMQAYNKGNNAKLVHIQKVYDFTGAFYGKDVKDLASLKDGADIAVPSDSTNLARALRLLAKANVITLDKPDSYAVTEENITANPKNITFSKIGLLNLNEAYNEKDLAFNYPDKISKLGLTPTKDAVIKEEKADQNYYALGVVAREDNKDSDAVKAFAKAVSSETIKKLIEEKYKDIYNAAF